MVQAIVFLPLLGFLIAGSLGRVIGPRPSEIVTTGFLITGAILSWFVFFQVGYGSGPFKVAIAPWISSGALQVEWALRIDTLTAVMLVVVNSVSALMPQLKLSMSMPMALVPALKALLHIMLC